MNDAFTLNIEANKLREAERWPQVVKACSQLIRAGQAERDIDLELTGHINRGLAQRHAGNLREAAAEFKHILRESRYYHTRDFAMAVFHYGCMELAAGKLDEGQKHLNWFAQHYERAIPPLQLTRLYAFDADLEMLLNDLNRALAYRPDMPAAHFARGMVYATQHDYQAALDEFQPLVNVKTLKQPAIRAIELTEKSATQTEPGSR